MAGLAFLGVSSMDIGVITLGGVVVRCCTCGFLSFGGLVGVLVFAY